MSCKVYISLLRIWYIFVYRNCAVNSLPLVDLRCPTRNKCRVTLLLIFCVRNRASRPHELALAISAKLLTAPDIERDIHPPETRYRITCDPKCHAHLFTPLPIRTANDTRSNAARRQSGRSTGHRCRCGGRCCSCGRNTGRSAATSCSGTGTTDAAAATGAHH